MSIKKVLKPAEFQGDNVRAPYFEGWYFKLVSADEGHKFALIPGIYLAEKPENSHSFVQVFDSNAEKVRYHRYPFGEFRAADDAFEVQVGPNFFSADTVRLAIDDDQGQLAGQLAFNHLTRWPVNVLSPGAMGWFAWVPFMECYHGVVSMDHTIQGNLELDGVSLDFTGGKGYIEKDWGKQFPSAYIWGQSNHFDQPGVSLMLSVAVIPWLKWSFGGFIIGILHDGVIHRFATYNRSRIKSLDLGEHEIRLVVENPSNRLDITAIRGEGGLLQAPTLTTMDRRIVESLDARLRVRLETRSGEPIFAGEGRHAGLETVGDLAKLVQMI